MQHPPKVQRRRRPRTRLLVILLCVGLVLGVAAILMLPLIRERFPAAQPLSVATESQERTLSPHSDSALESLTIRHVDGSGYTLEMQDGHLRLSRDGQWLDIDASEEENLIKAVTQTLVQGVVTEDVAEVAEHLSDMGLDAPRATALACFEDGSQTTLELGLDVPGTPYAYFRRSGDSSVYMCDSSVTEALLLTATRLLPVEQISISGLLVDQLVLTRGEETLAIAFANDGSEHISAAVVSPIRYPVAADQAEALLNALSSFRLGTHEAEASAATRAAYGLNDPELTVWLHQAAGVVSTVDESGQFTTVDVAEQSLQFVIGRPEGDFFYTCEYAGECYLISRFLIETLLGATLETLVTRTPANLDGAALRDVVIESPDAQLHLTAEYTERVLANNELETDAEGNVVYDISVTLNGEPAGEDLLTALTSRLNALTVSGDVPDGWTVPADESPRWRITLTTVGGTRRAIAAYRLDAFSDALAVDGVALHYAHEEAIDLVLADLTD